jgi:ABC-type multidrug transport system fused ATPase/permease subunit
MSSQIEDKLYEVVVFALTIIFFILPAVSYFYIVIASKISARKTSIPHTKEDKNKVYTQHHSPQRNFGSIPSSVASSYLNLPVAPTRILVESASRSNESVPPYWNTRIPNSPSVASIAASSTFKLFQEVSPILVSFSNITYSVENSRKKTSEPFVILNGVSGFMKPGSLCAIMGPSGII